MEINVDVIPTGTQSAVVYAPFDQALAKLKEDGYEAISLAQNAQLRIQQGADSPISRNGNWTREGVLYVPNKGIFLTKNSPIMQNPKDATQAHRESRDYFLTDAQVEQGLADSVQLSGEAIPTNRFGENEITNYAFGEVAEQYGKFLKEAGIKEMPVWIADLKSKPFARQMWFGNLDDRSELVGSGRDLDNGGRLRGIVYMSGFMLIWKMIIFILRFIL